VGERAEGAWWSFPTVAEAVASVLQGVDAGTIQYLVIETSGVTDPLSLIRLLDQQFGRLFRARLDSVVTVVDADVLHTELTTPWGDDAGGGADQSAAPPPRQ
jgi:G3E family GTPase